MDHVKTNILVVDDEWKMLRLLNLTLSQQGWNISEAPSADVAMRIFNNQQVDLVILDIMMPKTDGWEVCECIREKSQVPILFLTARNETKDKVRGLKIGADDYLTKPFEADELIARVEALLRRTKSMSITDECKSITLDEIGIFPDSRKVVVREEVVPLTPKEYDLFQLLAQNPKRAFSREQLLERVWGIDFFGDNRTVDQHVKNIREKLKKQGCSYNPIKTVWGFGYQLQQKADQQ